MDSSKTEKATINIGIMELAQIDLLVDSMLYTNRSDFIRIAIRDQLEKHRNDLEKLYMQSKAVNFEPHKSVYGGIGIHKINEKDLLDAKSKNKKLHIMSMGLLIFDKKIDPKLFEDTIESIKIYGKIQASKGILDLIEKKNLKI